MRCHLLREFIPTQKGAQKARKVDLTGSGGEVSFNFYCKVGQEGVHDPDAHHWQ